MTKLFPKQNFLLEHMCSEKSMPLKEVKFQTSWHSSPIGYCNANYLKPSKELAITKEKKNAQYLVA
jgi:hypothetical protein